MNNIASDQDSTKSEKGISSGVFCSPVHDSTDPPVIDRTVRTLPLVDSEFGKELPQIPPALLPALEKAVTEVELSCALKSMKKHHRLIR